MNGIELIRDGTIFSAGGTEIDFRTPDYSVWLTVKAEKDSDAEAVASALEAKFGTEGGTARQGTVQAALVGSSGGGASPRSEVGAGTSTPSSHLQQTDRRRAK